MFLVAKKLTDKKIDKKNRQYKSREKNCNIAQFFNIGGRLLIFNVLFFTL